MFSRDVAWPSEIVQHFVSFLSAQYLMAVLGNLMAVVFSTFQHSIACTVEYFEVVENTK